jgi:acetolactate synthase-1/2/3 large subunit
MPPTTIASRLLAHLSQEGLTHLFAIPGGPIMPLYEAAFATGTLTPVLAKQELGAAFMADGYARVRGLGACMVTSGPGATNALTGIACSFSDSIPVLLITGQVATSSFGRGAAQEASPHTIDVTQIYRFATKASEMLVDPTTIDATTQRLLRAMLSGRRGPAHLNLPANYARHTITGDLLPPTRYRPSHAGLDTTSIRRAADALATASHPAILAGHGVRLSGGEPHLRALAERLGIPVASTPKSKGVFPEDHPLSLGAFGFAGSPRSETYLLSDRCDVLLAVGTSLGEQATHGWDARLQPSNTLIHVDIDPRELGKNYPTDIMIAGDASTALHALSNALESPTPRDLEAIAARQHHLRALKAEIPAYLDPTALQDDSTPLRPQRVIAALQHHLPSYPLLFVDVGNAMAWAIHYLTVSAPDVFFLNMGLASMGHAIPAAIGACLASNNRRALALVGDAAFMMTGTELHTAVELSLPLVVIVLNNGGHGMVFHGERRQFGGRFNTSRFREPIDAAAMARAMGAAATKIRTPDELDRELHRAMHTEGPMLLDVETSIEEVPPMGMRLKTLERFFSGQTI